MEAPATPMTPATPMSPATPMTPINPPQVIPNKVIVPYDLKVISYYSVIVALLYLYTNQMLEYI